MSLNIDQLTKKIIYLSTYSGTKEMDKILGALKKKNIKSFIFKDFKQLEELLDIDSYSYTPLTLPTTT